MFQRAPILCLFLPSNARRYTVSAMKPLTTSVYTFCDLIAGGYLYVDKTPGIYELIRGYKGQYFLARPRRFGKSLLISTLKAIFQGRRELFDGLFLATANYDWKPYPVIHLDMGTAAAQTPEGLEAHLLREVHFSAGENNIETRETTATAAFIELIRQLAARDGKVVVLVDEYDKPLLGHLGEPTAKAIQKVLKQFYGVIKTTESSQRFALITGVSKFAKVSIFSDLNNLTDLTMSVRSATLLGYTQSELESNFPDYIKRLAGSIGKNDAETLDELRRWFNGYRFHQNAQTVYNPVSVMKCFYEQEFKNYWFETGTPTFLVDLLRKRPIDLTGLVADESDFGTYDPDKLAALPLLVQTGYLTIKGADGPLGALVYKLGYPNREIEISFNRCLAQGFTNLPPEEITGAQQRLVAALREGRIEDMLDTLKIFFAKVPNTITIDNEKYYQTIFFTVFTLLGVMIEVEVSTNIGRVDAVVKTAGDIFIFEFKLNGTAAEAMAQIRAKRYFEPYLDSGRRITLIGVEFARETRNLGEYRIEPLDAAQEPARIREPGEAYATTAETGSAESARREIALRMKALGIAPAIIAEVTGLPR